MRPILILALKGWKRVGSVTGLERSKNCSFCTVSAPGIFMPLIFIYSQQIMASLVGKAVSPAVINLDGLLRNYSWFGYAISCELQNISQKIPFF